MAFPHRERQFGRSESGAVALVFAFALPALLGAVGLAVDYSSAMRVKAGLQSAADAAALNAARELIIAEPTIARVKAIAKRTVDAELQLGRRAEIDWTVQTTLAPDNKAVVVSVSRPTKPVFGVLNALYAMMGQDGGAGLGDASATATARLSHSSKLCLLTLGDDDTSISLRTNARLTGASCSIHSNSRSRSGIRLESGAKLQADLVCSRGGIDNLGATFQGEYLNDCPPVVDPLRARAAPPVGPCLQTRRAAYRTGLITLNPGTYCGGIEIRGDAQVKLNPGTYVFLDGDLTVRGNAQLIGENVGLFFRGNTSYFRFYENALIDLMGPIDGPMSGILLWRDRVANLADKAVSKAAQLTNVINSDRARRLTGTIYLPEGSLSIDANAPVANNSDYTVILVRRLMLADGPNLVLNTNYGGSTVPVPQDLGPIGLKNLKLER
jgi:type II secretory pathway pseudopilin PulG